jgi:hypothetical protein
VVGSREREERRFAAGELVERRTHGPRLAVVYGPDKACAELLGRVPGGIAQVHDPDRL